MVGDVSDDFLKSRRFFRDDVAMTIPNARYLESALDGYDLTKCRVSSSSKNDKAGARGHDESLDESSRAMFRPAVSTSLSLSKGRSDMMTRVR